MNYFFQKMAVLANQIFECLYFLPRHTGCILEIHMKFALYHAVIQLAALVRRSAVAALEQRVRAEDILLHGGILCCAAECGVKLLRLLLVKKALTVGRVGEQNAAAAVIALCRVRLLEEYRTRNAGPCGRSRWRA